MNDTEEPLTRAQLLSRETLTTAQVQQLLGLADLGAARVQLRRWNIAAVGRDVESGQKKWPTEEIIERDESRPRPRRKPDETD